LTNEFSSVLTVMSRQGNILSGHLRNGWDGKKLENMTVKPDEVDGHHLSIIGHAVIDQVKLLLDGNIDLVNGFANRFVWALAKKARDLELGGKDVRLTDFAQQICDAQFAATKVKEIGFEIERSWWKEQYMVLNKERPGVIGAVTSRAPAHVRRFAAIYALLHKEKTVQKEHVEAALELWRYCNDSAEYILGKSTGNEMADKIAAALESRDLTRSEVSSLFDRNKKREAINAALLVLEQWEIAEWYRPGTRGGGSKWRRIG